MKKYNSSPTMKDVAREAGVSLGTVSKVFNGIPVGESYRKRVEEAAHLLGYQVNSYARGLKTNKTNTVALIMPSIINPFFGQLADHVSQVLTRRGYRMLLALTDYNLETEQHCIQMVRQNKVDGIIALTYNPNIEVDDTLPFVSIDRFFSASIPCVTSDNFGGGQMAAEKLAELGCRKLLFFRRGSTTPGEADKRGAGFETFCQMKNIDYTSLRLNDEKGFDPFYQFLEDHYRDGKLEYDGIFCSTDHFAHQVRKKLTSMGLRVPEDVQVIGFDGVRMFGGDELYCSTIVQPVQQIAETAVNILLSEDRSLIPALTCLPVSYAPGGTTRDSQGGAALGK